MPALKADIHETNMRPILSIGIPTYGRKQWLERNLSHIARQLKDIEPGLIEIVVSENAGNDGSWEHLKSLAPTTPFLKIHRNESNIGGEGNFYLLPSLCSGQYIWLLGDDDFIEDGAFHCILSALQKQPDYLALNFSPSDDALKLDGRPCWKLPRDQNVNNIVECCAVIPHFAMGFISAWIGKKEFFNRISSEDYTRFSKWGASIMADRYVGISDMPRGTIFASPMLKTRRAPAHEWPAEFDYFTWFFQGTEAVFDFIRHRSPAIGPVIRSRKRWLLKAIAVKRIVYERAVGRINKPRINTILFSGYRDYWQYWALCLPAMYLPGLGVLGRLLLRKQGRTREISN